jgi:hypothetical protein
MESEKDKWIKEILESGGELQKLHAPEGLLDKIRHQLLQPEENLIPLKQVRIALVAAAVLIAINAAILLSAKAGSIEKKQGRYGMESYNLNLY